MNKQQARAGATKIVAACLAAATIGVHSTASGGVAPFTEEAVQRGLVYQVQSWLGTQQFQGFGIAIVDLDNDKDQDVVLMGRSDGRVGFFENTGAGVFIDRSTLNQTGSPAVLTLSNPSGIAAADYNGDGLIDIYFTQEMYLPNVLLRNDGNFTFTDVSAGALVDNDGYGESAAWGDYDNDGWLDLYLGNYTFPTDQADPTRRNQLYRNRANGTFESVGAALGVDDFGLEYSAVWSDIDRNGTLDLYVVNDRGHLYRPNQLWRNDGGTFTSLCPQSGACLGLWAMGIGAGDFDGNGFSDFYCTNLPATPGYGGINPLMLNNGDTTFVEVAALWDVDQFIFSWAAIFFDYNNDRWLDLYVINQSEANRLYQHAGAPPAINVAPVCGVNGSQGYDFNCAVGDIDGDGDLDILVNSYGQQLPANVQLFINHEGETKNWARFNIVGTTPGNQHAIGANIDLRVGTQWQWREVYAGGNNFKAQNETVFHFGLDDAKLIDEMIVRWPGGSPMRTLTNYSANHLWTIYPPDALGDFDADGTFNVVDLLAIINAWGPVQPGSEICDTNSDGTINVIDLLFIINNWG